MKDFIIFFCGQEGSTAIVSHLKKLECIDILWFEPFDRHHMKKDKLVGKDLTDIFRLIFNKTMQEYNEQIDRIYSKYTNKKISNFDKNKSVGFKMRPRNIDDIETVIKENDVVVFILIRRNILRWALSRCRSNTLQFKLARGEITSNPKLEVNLKKLAFNIKKCKINIQQKETLYTRLKDKSINVHKIYYEDYCNNKIVFFKDIFKKLEIELTNDKLKTFVNTDIYFKKVHDNDISKFIINYDAMIEFLNKKKLID